ncbi:MAG: hypothetical protein WA873_16090, partial [Jannaschia helgolandensis]
MFRSIDAQHGAICGILVQRNFTIPKRRNSKKRREAGRLADLPHRPGLTRDRRRNVRTRAAVPM